MISECILLVFLLGFIYHYLPYRNLPPGPYGWPIFGLIPAMYPKQVQELKEKYGDIVMMKFGNGHFLYLTDYKLTKEAFLKTEFSGRPVFYEYLTFDDEKKQREYGGVVNSSGARWHNSRRFLLRHLRDLGMGHSRIEDLIMTEVQLLVEDFAKLTNEPNNLPFSTNVMPLNIIWQLIASKRYDFNDKQVKEFMDKMQSIIESFMYGVVPEFFPILKMPGFNSITKYVVNSKKIIADVRTFTNIVQPAIDEHIKNLDMEVPRDLMDEYLIEMKLRTRREYHHFSNDDLLRTTYDLFLAGNDTTSMMTQWILLYLAKYTETQTYIQELIDEVVPRDSLPGLQHRERLAYLDATINEIQRHSSLNPFGVFRATMVDTTFANYFIPKNTIVFASPVISHHDPKYWNEPHIFEPKNFLDENGRFFSQKDGFHPFGLGKRQCLGENFARMELFLIMGSLLHRFTFRPVEGEEIDLKPRDIPLTNRSREQKLLITERI